PDGHAVVEDLARPDRRVALRAEMLGKGDDVGQVLPEVRGVLLDARRVGPPAGHEGRSARVAERILAVGAVEPDPSRRQAVDVRRPDERMAIAADAIVEIVRGDKEDIELPLRVGDLGSAAGGEGRQEDVTKQTGYFVTGHG